MKKQLFFYIVLLVPSVILVSDNSKANKGTEGNPLSFARSVLLSLDNSKRNKGRGGYTFSQNYNYVESNLRYKQRMSARSDEEARRAHESRKTRESRRDEIPD